VKFLIKILTQAHKCGKQPEQSAHSPLPLTQ
jgi:hypothetical protein